jgi:hypothetical protein
LRQVSARGVNQVMKVFARHFTESAEEPVETASGFLASPDVLCDEEEIERAIVKSGVRRG